jgi:hypothetical protein
MRRRSQADVLYLPMPPRRFHATPVNRTLVDDTKGGCCATVRKECAGFSKDGNTGRGFDAVCTEEASNSAVEAAAALLAAGGVDETFGIGKEVVVLADLSMSETSIPCGDVAVMTAVRMAS